MQTQTKGYLYFPGCSLKATGIAYEESLQSLFRLLDLSLKELKDWNCCGATSYMSIDEASAFVLAARNLSLAKQNGSQDLIAPCSACYLVLKKTKDYASRYPIVGQQINQALKRASLEANLDVYVRHPLEVLYKDIGPEVLRSKIKRNWPGGRVVAYYGCQAVRPYQEVDRSYNPTKMDELLEAVSIPTTTFPLKTKCCGGSLTGTIHTVGLRLNYILLKEARRRGAEAIATICPLCQFNLDAYQAEMNKEFGEAFDMPVLYLTQALGFVLGANPEELGLHRAISGKKRIRELFYG